MGELFGGINLFDLFFVVLVIYFMISSSNFIFALSDLLGFILTVIFSYKFYIFFADLLSSRFIPMKGLSKAVGFFMAWFLFEIIFFTLGRYILSKIPDKIHKHYANRFFAFAPSAIQAVIFYFLIVVTVFSLPVKATIKEEILQSRTGSYLISFSRLAESKIKSVFGDAANETLNFITIKESADEINLGFKTSQDSLKEDPQSEQIMLRLVNQERENFGLQPLVENVALVQAARAYGREMFINGFFSHQSQVDDTSPAQRLERLGIPFSITGENLAYAPDVYVAHHGLMNSPGHRANILSSDYKQIGIGVMDGGIYGRMFVQEFTD